MKIGIISDIHSNVIALKTVLKEFENMNVDKIICCGDEIGIGPSSEETVQELMKWENKLVAVRGNHEQYLVNGLPKQVHDNKRQMSLEEIQNHNWNHSQLSDSSIQFIKKLPLTQELNVENFKIYITHYPINSNGEYKKHIKDPLDIDVKELFSDISADIFLYGHTHTSSKVLCENVWYINPGSVGCPMKSNLARCGILAIDNGRVLYEALKLSYDVQGVINDIKAKKYPAYEEMLDIFFRCSRRIDTNLDYIIISEIEHSMYAVA